MKELESELYAFPHGTHDDVIDALSWQIDKRYLARDYVVEKPKKPTNERMQFTLEQIRNSVRNQGGVPRYPFQKQLKEMFPR